MRRLILISSLLLLSACVAQTVSVIPEVDSATRDRRIHLANEYRALATFEEEVLGDAESASRFRNKSVAALSGKDGGPDRPSGGKLSPSVLATFAMARSRLEHALETPTGTENGAVLAMAQVKYDCWLAMTADGQSGASVCQQEFEDAMSFLKIPQQAPPKMDYAIAFESGNAALDATGMGIAQDVAAQFGDLAQYDIILIGRPDTRGSKSANEQLSVRRVVAVRNALLQYGADMDRIRIQADDGKRRGKSGRVDIAVRQTGNGDYADDTKGKGVLSKYMNF